MKISLLAAAFAIASIFSAIPAHAIGMYTGEITRTARCADAMTATQCQVEHHFSLSYGFTTYAECSAGVRVLTREGEWRIYPLRTLGSSKREALADMNETKSLLSLIPRCR